MTKSKNDTNSDLSNTININPLMLQRLVLIHPCYTISEFVDVLIGLNVPEFNRVDDKYGRKTNCVNYLRSLQLDACAL